LTIAIIAFAVVFHVAGGAVSAFGVPVLLIIAIACIVLAARSTRPDQPNRETTVIGTDTNLQFPQSRSIEKDVTIDTTDISLHVLGTQYRRDQWASIETTVDDMLDKYMRFARQSFDAHTLAVFFPTLDGGYKLRRFDSRGDNINASAVIHPGVGLLGGFLKEGTGHVSLHDIVTESTTLYYYTSDAGIHSLIASPIIAHDNDVRGIIIADSINKQQFSKEQHDLLSSLGQCLGLAVYYAYVYNEHKLEHVRIAAMSTIEKYFFNNLNIDSILDKMVEIIQFAIGCDRITISLTNAENTTATVRRAWGLDEKQFTGLTFSLDSKTLMSLLYAKNVWFVRNFSEDRYELRYSDTEPVTTTMHSFLAYPIGVDKCNGAILLESSRKDAFSDSIRDLLGRIATSAGLALEKLEIFNQAQTLATHDGLTGLLNHRQFQAMLKDEITRAIRYEDPLSLVICDIDFFKKINDTHGHQVGDIVLKEIAKKLKDNIRVGVDIAARYGGEEFALILVKTDGPNAVETVDRIRIIIAEALYKASNNQNIHVTMSFGIAVYGQHAKQIDALIQKADKALYRAKENGRNRVELF